MEIVHSEDQLKKYINEAVIVSGSSPVLIDSYLRDAIEVDIDTLSDGSIFDSDRHSGNEWLFGQIS